MIVFALNLGCGTNAYFPRAPMPTFFSSIILRFRDLSNPAGTTTIGEHKRIIADTGYVWWGWWHKQGETVPENALREILAAITTSGPYKVLLFDTGKYKLWRAHLIDIKWDTRLTPIAMPERTATPNYYGDAHYLAWFKLESIEDPELSEKELQDWSYFRIDEFFDTKKSAFHEFYDKQLTSFKELRNQDRTIWFIRPKRSTDKVHEIHVHDRTRIAPSNFSEQVVQLHTPNLLWVSDPHFSKDHHDFPRRPEISRTNLSETIRRDLEHIGRKDIGGLLISGDLTWQGARDEYEWATEFINDVKSWARLTASQVRRTHALALGGACDSSKARLFASFSISLMIAPKFAIVRDISTLRGINGSHRPKRRPLSASHTSSMPFVK
jgi:hypothetical protein